MLTIVCDMLEATGKTYFHHDDVRLSQHKFGRALDFHLTDYIGMSDCRRLYHFHQDFIALADWMVFTEYEKMGLGIYPQWNNPGFHLDTLGLDPGEQANRRWSQIDGEYVPYIYGVEWLSSELKECRG